MKIISSKNLCLNSILSYIYEVEKLLCVIENLFLKNTATADECVVVVFGLAMKITVNKYDYARSQKLLHYLLNMLLSITYLIFSSFLVFCDNRIGYKSISFFKHSF